MKKYIILIAVFTVSLIILPRQQAHAQILDAINAAIEEAITQVDLGVQRVQAQTIWLQNTEAQIENEMGLSNLNDISSWLKKEKDLYSSYYQDLQQVKTLISDYDEVKRIISEQKQLVVEYRNAYSLFQKDKNFSPVEINNMSQVYSGILTESSRDLTEISMAITSFQTQMTDAARLELIHHASNDMQHNLNNLRQYNNGNMQITLQRAQELNDMNTVKQLYGLPQN
jgi:hypothetical protein